MQYLAMYVTCVQSEKCLPQRSINTMCKCHRNLPVTFHIEWHYIVLLCCVEEEDERFGVIKNLDVEHEYPWHISWQSGW